MGVVCLSPYTEAPDPHCSFAPEPHDRRKLQERSNLRKEEIQPAHLIYSGMARKESDSFSQSIETDHISNGTQDIPTGAGNPFSSSHSRTKNWDSGTKSVLAVTLSKSVHFLCFTFHLYSRNHKSRYLLRADVSDEMSGTYGRRQRSPWHRDSAV